MCPDTLRNLRMAVRSSAAESVPTPSINVTRRMAIVSNPLVIDWATRKVSVEIGGSGIAIPGVRFTEEVFPVAGATCWVDFMGETPLLVAMQAPTLWTDWIPTHTNFPAGTTIAKYYRTGPKCDFSFQRTFTGGLAAAPMSFTLPFPAVGISSTAIGRYLRTGVRHFVIVGAVGIASSTMTLFTDVLTTNTTGEMTGTNPAAIASGDILIVSGVYHC